MRCILSNKKSYTLLEIMAVISILIFVMAIGIPKFNTVIERFRAQEAVPFMGAVYEAEMQYYLDNGGFPGTIPFNDPKLAPYIDTTMTLKYFKNVVLGCGSGKWGTCSQTTMPCFGPQFQIYDFVVRMDRTDDSYILFLTDKGKIGCIDTSQGPPFFCGKGICTKIGFPP